MHSGRHAVCLAAVAASTFLRGLSRRLPRGRVVHILTVRLLAPSLLAVDRYVFRHDARHSA